MRYQQWIIGVAAVLFGAAAIAQQPVRIASKNFTEQFVLAEL
ncbi:MAG: hypothetical protein ABI831_19955 [Betaproteobacteria bacterium]